MNGFVFGGMFLLAGFVIQSVVTFALVYFGARLAIKHERRNA